MSKPVEEMDATEVLREMNEIMPLSDFVYDVRSAATEGQRWGPWNGASWDHPMVERWGRLCMRVESLLKG
jgi:hypothetical protein